VQLAGKITKSRWSMKETMSLLLRKDSENYEQREIGEENVAVQLAGKITKSRWSTLGRMSLLLRKDSENDERETEIGGLPKIITRVLPIWWWILAYAPCIRITLMHNNFGQF
jgi:hypothetical protein